MRAAKMIASEPLARRSAGVILLEPAAAGDGFTGGEICWHGRPRRPAKSRILPHADQRGAARPQLPGLLLGNAGGEPAVLDVGDEQRGRGARPVGNGRQLAVDAEVAVGLERNAGGVAVAARAVAE